jgi:hypothetical protein
LRNLCTLPKKQWKFCFHTPLSLANHTPHTTNNTITTNTAANAAGGTTTNNDMDISVSKDGSEDNSKDETSDDNKGTEDAVFCAARDIQNRMSRRVGTAGMEDRYFCDFFGINISIMIMVWDMLMVNGLRPEKSCPKHLL